jgi:two-component system, chemotaxis family, CheB/CheR fusion protein
MAAKKKKPTAKKEPAQASTSQANQAASKKALTRLVKKAAKTSLKQDVSAHLKKATDFPIIAIGASAGGLETFTIFFKAISAKSNMAFVLITHLDPTHISLLPELLQKSTKMIVKQVIDGMRLHPNTVYVIPPKADLEILNGVFQLFKQETPRGVKLPIDTFFHSLAKDQGSNAIGIILSGTGTDGTLGIKTIKGEAGMVMVQTEESAKYDGMPHSAIATGLADYILPPEKMPEQLVQYAARTALRARGAESLLLDQGELSNALQKIFILLRIQTEHDFSLYKQNTIVRRIERRMHVHQIDAVSDYVHYLKQNEREVDILFKELLIGVTRFFRDPEAFDKLKEQLFPNLLAQKPNDYTIRCWIPGCSSGEEAYSIAILLLECMEEADRHFNVQIFGTDIDEEAVNLARGGLYPANIAADISPERLRRFFTKEDDSYQIKKQVREMLVFAPQNMIKDPPFTKLDLLCCRNVLIYLGMELQRKLLPTFHYTLKPDGILFLGSSETVGTASELFSLEDKKWKIYRRKPSTTTSLTIMDTPAPVSETYEALQTDASTVIREAEEFSAFQMVEAILQHTDAPPCAIIDAQSNIIYIHGRTGRYLEPAAGKISIHILEMARPGLKSQLAQAIREVAANRQETLYRGIKVEFNGGHFLLDLRVRPVLEQSAIRGLMMVVFEETSSKQPQKVPPEQAEIKKSNKTSEELERELLFTRENLQTTIEEMETSNEELKSTNEELQSTNEELQSTNEELETSKEELQSLNEESATVNAELQSRIEELSHANDDMKNLLDSTQIATLFLDTELCIRRYTPKMMDIFPLTGTDIGRPLVHLASPFEAVDLSEHADEVLANLAIQELELPTKTGKLLAIRILPYRTTNNVIDGVVATFEDISERKKAAIKLQASEDFLQTVYAHNEIGVFVINVLGEDAYNYMGINLIYEKYIGLKNEEVISMTPKELESYGGKETTDFAIKRYNECVEQRKTIEDIYADETAGDRIWWLSRLTPIFDKAGKVYRIVGNRIAINRSLWSAETTI